MYTREKDLRGRESRQSKLVIKQMKPVTSFIHVVVALILLLTPLSAGQSAPPAQEDISAQRAQALMDQLTPEEKVGQLFLITFQGPEAGANAQNGVYELISKYHIGGVVLRADNDNFIAHDRTIPIALSLTRQLQANKYSASQQNQTNPTTGETFQPAFIPLFIGIAQEGGGSPYDQILSSSMTSLPSQMAIGATWDPDYANQVGKVLGSELSAMGINLLLGPSLDVLESLHLEGSGDLGIRTFGGDPYWVGEMGKAYISGVHEGSGGEMAVIAKHFPGYGSSDRLPEEEVATVRKSLQQLKQVELAPFFAVTGDAPESSMRADGLLTSHIRYQGFQDNIRRLDRPVSFDREAFNQLMSLPSFESWRQEGGVMVSDDLGGTAVKRFYETSGQTYSGRYVARDAFQAGNDILFLGDFTTAEEPDQFINIINTLELFTQGYRQDPLFAQRVDESVLRILTLKMRIYNNTFSLNQTWASQTLPSTFGKSGNVTLEVMRQAATLISPSQAELHTTLPDPPGRNDRIVFITDTRTERQCSYCPFLPTVAVDALESMVLRLYSPQTGGQIVPRNLASYSFTELQEMLDIGSEIEQDLRLAKWIVFILLNENPAIPQSMVLRKFLDNRPDLYQQKNLIVFALNAPYFLDATDISKLTAYYGLYSQTPAAIDIAARLLFKDIPPNGASPVSISGAGYDLNTTTFPDPEQAIQLFLDNGSPEASNDGGTASPTPAPQFKIGDFIPVRTGIILDKNGHQVPDRTIVRFVVTRGEGVIAQIVESETSQGIARANIRVESSGLIQIRAESDLARTVTPLAYDIPAETEPTPTQPTPTGAPTETPTPTSTVSPTPTFEPTPTPIPPRDQTNFGDWSLALALTFIIGLSTYWASSMLGQVRWGVRAGFLVLIGGLAAYTYIALGMPGSKELLQDTGARGVLLATLLGSAIGIAASWSWRAILKLKKD
jgi:beta-N-acetylhexosaminidase